MVDKDTRSMGAGEETPDSTVFTTGERSNFNMGIEGARDYKSLLTQGVVRENPGAPIPMGSGAPVDESLYGTNHFDTDVPRPAQEMVSRSPVVEGTHKDPMATWINDGSVPAGTTGYAGMNVRPQSGGQRARQFDEGEHDYR